MKSFEEGRKGREGLRTGSFVKRSGVGAGFGGGIGAVEDEEEEEEVNDADDEVVAFGTSEEVRNRFAVSAAATSKASSGSAKCRVRVETVGVVGDGGKRKTLSPELLSVVVDSSSKVA